MPLYEYRCRSCHHQFEVQQSFSEDALTICPECQGELRKVFNPVGISFKGSGFYKNDSRSSSSSSSSSSTASSDSSGGSESTPSTGSKEPASTGSTTSTTPSTSVSSGSSD